MVTGTLKAAVNREIVVVRFAMDMNAPMSSKAVIASEVGTSINRLCGEPQATRQSGGSPNSGNLWIASLCSQ